MKTPKKTVPKPSKVTARKSFSAVCKKGYEYVQVVAKIASVVKFVQLVVKVVVTVMTHVHVAVHIA